jgi:UDP-GlcNAc:undecaprenyl-phosphate GlcNAc-1-phosphate transferase
VPEDILLYSALLAGVICSFLAFNLGLIDGKKIFLGDSGSMLVGLYITNMSIEISQASASNSGVTVPASLCLWLTAVPVTDMLVTFMARILKGKSPFAPDRTHLHHRLRDIGLSKWYVLLTILAASAIIFWGGAAISLLFGEAASLLAYVIYCISYTLFIVALGRAQTKVDLASAE